MSFLSDLLLGPRLSARCPICPIWTICSVMSDLGGMGRNVRPIPYVRLDRFVGHPEDRPKVGHASHGPDGFRVC